MNIWWVSSEDGDDVSGTGSREEPFETIEKAISVFENGDQIRLLDGTYTPTDSVVLTGKSGSIFSESPLGSYIQPQKTSVHQACIVLSDSERFTVQGVNVLQASDPDGNLIGIYAENIDTFLCLTTTVSGFRVPSGSVVGIFAAASHGRVEECTVFDLANAKGMVYGVRTMGIPAIDCTCYQLSGVEPDCDVKGIEMDGLSEE